MQLLWFMVEIGLSEAFLAQHRTTKCTMETNRGKSTGIGSEPVTSD